MEKNSHPGLNSLPVAVVGKSALFPASAAPKAFWPNLLGLKGLMSGLASGQWPFSEFFTEVDLKNLKGFVMSSGLLATGELPKAGFEIPPEVLKIKDVIPVLALVLAKQALENTKCHKDGKLPPESVQVLFGMISDHVLIQDFQASLKSRAWKKALEDAEIPREKIDTIIHVATSLASRPFGSTLAQTFAKHYGFVVAQENLNGPLSGTLGLLESAIQTLQFPNIRLVITGGIDSCNSVFACIDGFQSLASGLPVLREGIGMLALRRLDEAKRDGDEILAVITAIDASSVTFAPLPGTATGAPVKGTTTGTSAPVKTQGSQALPLPDSFDAFLAGGNFPGPFARLSTLSSAKRMAFLREKRFVKGGSFSETGTDQTRLSKSECTAASWLPPALSDLYRVPGTGSELFRGLVQGDHLAQFVRVHPAEILYDSTRQVCRNLPFNPLTVSVDETEEAWIARGGFDPNLSWKKVRDCWVKETGTRRFFHDLLGALFGTFVSRVVLRNPKAWDEIATRPVMYLANHQIGLESPLFMTLSYAMSGVPIQAIAKPDHVNAWLSFLMAFAEDSLGGNQPFRLMYFDKTQPQTLIEKLKNMGEVTESLLVHVEGTRASGPGQPVTRLSSIFLDMAIQKNVPMVPVRFVGGLSPDGNNERLDFPAGNGKQDYFIGAPIFPDELKKMPYGQRPKFVMDQINNLGPLNDEDLPLPPNKKFEEKTKFFIETFGFPKMQAMLFAILGIIDDPCEETALLIKAVQSGKLDSKSADIPPVLKNFLVHVKTKFA